MPCENTYSSFVSLRNIRASVAICDSKECIAALILHERTLTVSTWYGHSITFRLRDFDCCYQFNRALCLLSLSRLFCSYVSTIWLSLALLYSFLHWVTLTLQSCQLVNIA